jgi:hypothetical protein
MKLDALDQLELYEEAMGKRGIIATSSSAQETRGKGEPGGAIQISGLGPFQETSGSTMLGLAQVIHRS